MGTLPNTVIFFAKPFSGFSATARKINAGPSVINTYRKEGGYFVRFKKDKTVKAAFFWTDQWEKSP